MNECIIFSVYNSKYNNYVNETNHEDTIKYLTKKGIKFKEVTGVYNGFVERAIIVDNCHRDIVNNLAYRYCQESILLLDSRRQAWLASKDTRDKYLGRFEPVTKAVAESRGSYTIDNKGNYYITMY